MARNPILVGNRSFALKKDAEDACREILYRYEPGSRISEHADEQFLLDLLELHPQRDEKMGCGVEYFEIRVNPKFVRQRSFYLIRVDRSETDFSFMKCLKPPSHRQLVMMRCVMRYRIRCTNSLKKRTIWKLQCYARSQGVW